MRRSLGILALLFSVFAGQSGAQIPVPTFRSSSQLVLVPVTVTNRHGKTVDELQASDFSVFDNQQQQRIVSFGMDDAPCSITIILDISGSMRNTLAGAKEVLRSVFNTANPGDEFQLLTVSTHPAAVSTFTTDFSSLEDEVGSARSNGMTALLDTIHLGIERLRDARLPRRALLVLSDGIDNHSRYSQSALLNAALEADVQVYSMIFDTGAVSNTVPFRPLLVQKAGDRALDRQGPDFLEKIADKTGGLYFHVHNDEDANIAVTKTGRALRTEYVIGFQPSPAVGASQWHRIRVRSSVPKVDVHARNGYFAR